MLSTRGAMILLSSLSLISELVIILLSLIMLSFVSEADDAESFKCIEIFIWPNEWMMGY